MSGVRIDGLREFTRALKAVDKSLTTEMRKVNLDASRQVVSMAQSNALAEKGRGRFAALFKPAAGPGWAGVRYKASDTFNITRRGRTPTGGWLYGSYKFGQFSRFVGNQYAGNVATPGYGDFGPRAYAIGPALTTVIPQIRQDHEAKLAQVFRPAFPKGA